MILMVNKRRWRDLKSLSNYTRILFDSVAELSIHFLSQLITGLKNHSLRVRCGYWQYTQCFHEVWGSI